MHGVLPATATGIEDTLHLSLVARSLAAYVTITYVALA